MTDVSRPGGQTRWSALRGIAIDVTPLRVSPAYRRIWVGQAVSVLGTQLTAVAAPLQVYAMTRSSFLVGLVGLAALVPLVGFGLWGGAIADAADRRALLVVTTVGAAAASVVLTVQAAVHLHSLGVLYGCVAVQSAFFAVDSPARRALIPRLIGARLLPAANALSQVLWSIGLVGGPLLAGLLVGSVGYTAAYGLDAVSYLAVLWSVLRLDPTPPEGGGTRAGWRAVVAGLGYLRTQQVVLMTFVVDLVAMVFGMPRALFPALATHQFHGGAGTAGVLYAAPAIGALVGGVLSGWVGRVHRQGVAVYVAVAVWGGAITLFGVVPQLAFGVVLLAIAGAADMVSAVYRNTMLALASPDAMRGRLGGVYTVVVAGGPRLGDVESGAVAAMFGVTASVVSGGVAVIAGVLLMAALMPSFARYDDREVAVSG